MRGHEAHYGSINTGPDYKPKVVLFEGKKIRRSLSA